MFIKATFLVAIFLVAHSLAFENYDEEDEATFAFPWKPTDTLVEVDESLQENRIPKFPENSTINRQWVVKYKKKHRELCVTQNKFPTCAWGFAPRGAVEKKVVAYCTRKKRPHPIFETARQNISKGNYFDMHHFLNHQDEAEVQNVPENQNQTLRKSFKLKRRKIYIRVTARCVKIQDLTPLRPHPRPHNETGKPSPSPVPNPNLVIRQRIFENIYEDNPRKQVCISTAPLPECRRGFQPKISRRAEVQAYCGPKSGRLEVDVDKVRNGDGDEDEDEDQVKGRVTRESLTIFQRASEQIMRGHLFSQFEGLTFARKVKVDLPSSCEKKMQVKLE